MSFNRLIPRRTGPRFLVGVLVTAVVALAPAAAWTQTGGAGPNIVRVLSDANGAKLQVDGQDLMVLGMNWDYMPIGQNYTYDFWGQPDDFIETALAREMSLLKGMGVNTIRVYAGMPPRWVRYIYERYGIYTVLNHTVARYGYTLDGAWIPSVDYSDPHLREAVTAEVLAMVEQYKDTPGLLMWLLGNENNYGLSWSSFEIEALPEGERHAARARHLYSLFGEIIRDIKSRDTHHPVAIANGDLQYIDLIAEECPELDILGSNVYRGISARDFFQEIKDKLGIPALFTEFGSDAWNTKDMREDQAMQARYLIGQWQEIYEQSYGKGRVGNAIGGLTFQWSDGWWKFRQDERLDIHDTNASWPNGGYVEDFVEGENNMNEEWWGICAKGPPDSRGLYQLYPRAAYYALQQAYRLPPYAPSTDLEAIRSHFARITPAASELQGRGDRSALLTESISRARLSGLRLEFETYSTGGARTTTPDDSAPQDGYPSFLGFDQMQSFYADFEAKPAENVIGTLTINMLGSVPVNPIDEIFYENRGRPQNVVTEDGTVERNDIERLKVYRAGVSWDDKWFMLDGFYRTGHFHWGYEGDFFGLYREAYYGDNIDIYNGVAPVGFEIDGKRGLTGLTLAMGPELWWGANPAVMLKANRRLGRFDATAIYQEDLQAQGAATSSFAIPVPPTRKGAVALATTYRAATLEFGGIWSGNTKIGETFQVAEETGDGYNMLQDEIVAKDTFGAKAKVTLSKGRWNWYAQAAYMGLVADGGPTAIPTFTGWQLKDTGSGNQANIISGLTYTTGNLQIAPNVLYQKPIVGPVPGDVPSPGRPRNVLDDPFAVRANRETFGAELLFTYDPTPATWMWHWDSIVREDARFAGNLGFVFRRHHTTQDASIGFLGDGRTTFAFPGAPPPRDHWEINGRVISKLRPDLRIVSNFFAGTGEPNGDDARLIHRYGLDARVVWGSLAFETYAKINDWGPYDYHRDFNLTFPVQLMGDISKSLGSPEWFGFPQTRLGVRGTWRSLDEFSPRYCPARFVDATGVGNCAPPTTPGDDGREWEIRTYLHFAI